LFRLRGRRGCEAAVGQLEPMHANCCSTCWAYALQFGGGWVPPQTPVPVDRRYPARQKNTILPATCTFIRPHTQYSSLNIHNNPGTLTRSSFCQTVRSEVARTIVCFGVAPRSACIAACSRIFSMCVIALPAPRSKALAQVHCTSWQRIPISATFSSVRYCMSLGAASLRTRNRIKRHSTNVD